MNRTTKRRRVRKEPEIVYQPTADDFVRVAEEVSQFLESNLRVEEKACRNKRAFTPAQRAEQEREIAEWRRFIDLFRRDPARLHAMHLRIAIRLKDLKAIERMPPANRRAFTGGLIGMEIFKRTIREIHDWRAMTVEDRK
jgi:hypothetical protein